MSEVEAREAESEPVEDVLPKLADLDSLTPDSIVELRATVLVHPEQRRKVEREVAESGDTDPRRRGILQWLVAAPAKAVESLRGAGHPLATFVLAKSLDESRRAGEALEVLAKGSFGDDREPVRLELDALAKLRRFDDLATRLDTLEKEKAWKEHADLYYFRGLLAENDGDYEAAEDLYEKALTLDDSHPRALFRLAYRFDMRREDEMAIEFYERCTKAHPPHIHAYLNLGVMYEDSGDYEKAVECFQRVLQFDPTHARARVFLKDAEASLVMYYDEDEEKKEDRLNQILRIPVTDFELSVRSRNCLEKMNLRVLGDLIKMTESELLSFKNFGETSLAEIKEILASKGLRLGMSRELEADSSMEARLKRMRKAEPADGDAASRPISELELSVRSRRAMALLGIQTIGDLTERSEEELKGVKNFGATSLNEVKRKLQEYGLSLKS